jgi:Flp pilus assembly protein TadG
MREERRRVNERGAMSMEFLLVISSLMLVFLLMLQYAVRAHAQRIATAAAEEALAAASAYDGTTGGAEAVGDQYLDDLGPGLTNTRVVVTRTPTTATATVSGDVDQIVPFLPVRISVHLQGPVEVFVETP